MPISLRQNSPVGLRLGSGFRGREPPNLAPSLGSSRFLQRVGAAGKTVLRRLVKEAKKLSQCIKNYYIKENYIISHNLSFYTPDPRFMGATSAATCPPTTASLLWAPCGTGTMTEMKDPSTIHVGTNIDQYSLKIFWNNNL